MTAHASADTGSECVHHRIVEALCASQSVFGNPEPSGSVARYTGSPAASERPLRSGSFFQKIFGTFTTVAPSLEMIPGMPHPISVTGSSGALSLTHAGKLLARAAMLFTIEAYPFSGSAGVSANERSTVVVCSLLPRKVGPAYVNSDLQISLSS